MHLTLHVEEPDRIDGSDDEDIDTDNTLVTTAQLKVSLKQLEFTHHRSVLHLLERTPKRPAGTTILGLVRTVMTERGWKRKKPYTERGGGGGATTVNTPVAVPQAPCIHSYRLYHLLAIDARALERLVQYGQGEKRKYSFNIESCMEAYCEQYQVHRGKTFPSLRHDIANHAERLDRVSAPERGLMTKARNKMMAQQRQQQDNGQPFIYDNDDIHGAINGDEDDSDDDNTNTNQKKKRYNKRKPNKELARSWTRLIPITILPLFMAHLPPCFTHVNEMMYACEMLESRLWQHFTGMSRYPGYLMEQVSALGANRRYMAFVHQQAHLKLTVPLIVRPEKKKKKATISKKKK